MLSWLLGLLQEPEGRNLEPDDPGEHDPGEPEIGGLGFWPAKDLATVRRMMGPVSIYSIAIRRAKRDP